MLQSILLQGVRLFAYHGVAEFERKVGTYYRIDLALDVNFSEAMRTDNLGGTVSYAEVYEVLREQMAQPRHLLEHVAKHLLDALFHRFISVEAIELRLLKESPPIDGADCQGCGIQIAITRDEFFAI